MADLEVDPDRLAKDGDEFNNLASVAYSIYGSLAKAASLIKFPDDDEISKVFAEQWNSLVNGAKGMLLGFKDGMTNVSGNVFDTAALYKKSNDVNTESVPLPPTRR
ncbi:MAG TPA: hypothetical protein VFI65_13470 [Streptosporangiaceae bacterium]|nr:hypothetical protein [Streptosporangiaceae bacterium]